MCTSTIHPHFPCRWPLLLAGFIWLAVGCTGPDARQGSAALADAEAPEAAAVDRWLAENAVRLQSLEPSADLTDLEPLREIIGDARFVLLGEPTHGDREVVRLRHRMVRFLAEEMGFTDIALELPMAEKFDVHRYVTTGAGTPESALATSPVWAMDVESVADMPGWVRRHNLDPTTERPVGVFGFDMQSPERAAQVTIAYLERVDPDRAEAARRAFGHVAITISDPDQLGYRPIVGRDFDAAVHAAVTGVEADLEAHRRQWSTATGAEDWAMARQHARLLRQWVLANMDDGRLYNVVRDRTMADNLSWILEQGGPDARVVAWAHNIHFADFIARHVAVPVPVAGHNLRRMHGDDVVIISFHFGCGAFNALDSTGPALGLRSFDVGPAPEDTLEARFAAAGLELAVVDLRRLPPEGPVAEWFAAPQKTRFSWGGYDRTAPEDHITSYVFPDTFDALAFVQRAVPTRHIESADYGEMPVLTRPVNLDFEQGLVGAEPMGWLVCSKLRRLGYRVETTAEDPARGRRAARIHRSLGDELGIAGSLLQRVDARPYRGRVVRVRAAVRAELEERGLAFLRLHVVPAGIEEVHDLPDLLLDTLDEHRVTGSDWHELEIVASVSEAAGTLVYGLFLAGAGSAWIDDVSVEILDR